MTDLSAAPPSEPGDRPGADGAAPGDDPGDPSSSGDPSSCSVSAAGLTLEARDDSGGLWPDVRPALDMALRAFWAAGPPPLAGSVMVLFADDACVRPLNAHWRGQDKPTNILSFPADAALPDGSEAHAGDLVLAGETVAREAAEQGKSLHDHLVHLLVHGLFHLAGLDHQVEAEAEAMEAAERAALKAVGIADPYAVSSGGEAGR